MKIRIDDIDKKTPFTVPDGYFEDLTNDIQARVTDQNPESLPVVRLKWALIPALVLVLISGFWFYQLDSNTITPADALLSEVSNEDILDYLDQSDLSISELISMSIEPSDLIDNDPNFLEGVDLEQENLDELINTFDLKELYL